MKYKQSQRHIPSSWLPRSFCSCSHRNSICLFRKQKHNIFSNLFFCFIDRMSIKTYLSSFSCCCELWNIATKPMVNMIMPRPMKNRLRPARAIRDADILLEPQNGNRFSRLWFSNPRQKCKSSASVDFTLIRVFDDDGDTQIVWTSMISIE